MSESNSELKHLEKLYDQYKKIQLSAQDRITRYQELFSRKSYSSWPEEKKRKSLRRLNEAHNQLNESSLILDQIQARIDRSR